jgi:Ca2+-binding RTX toxin-like protein
VTANNLGDTIVSNNSGNHLIGGTGADTFILGRGGDIATGGAGGDTFVFNETPWAAAHITDFTPGQDSIDLTGLLAHSGYAGSDAIGDGFIKITGDASGHAQIWSDLGHGTSDSAWWMVTTLDDVSSSSVHMQGAFIFG